MQFLAFGFGSGLSPGRPAQPEPWLPCPCTGWYRRLEPASGTALFVVLTAVLGIWICDVASRQLGVHDHPGIVWDEFVGYWITMWAVPVDWVWMLAGFVVFRVYRYRQALADQPAGPKGERRLRHHDR